MRSSIPHLVAAVSAALSVASAAQVRPPAILPLESEPPPKLLVYPPLPEALARGVVIIQHRTEHLRVIPIFGKHALDVSPRVGHLHVTVDARPGTWAHTSEDPIIVVGLEPGAHMILIEVADPTHRILARESVEFTVPERAPSGAHTHGAGAATPGSR